MDTKFQLSLDWQTIEKILIAVWSLFVFFIFTVARPWLGRQIIRLLKEDKASYKEFTTELWQSTLDKIELAVMNAAEALLLVKQAKSEIERLQSASEEQARALVEMTSLPEIINRMDSTLTFFLKDFVDTKLLIARIDERQKARASKPTLER